VTSVMKSNGAKGAGNANTHSVGASATATFAESPSATLAIIPAFSSVNSCAYSIYDNISLC
jgi:hypothetical protein